jgi:hypothetical protein
VREAVFKSDMRKYNKKLPESLSKDEDDHGCHRPARLGKFVLDALLEHGKKIWADHNNKYKKLRLRSPSGPNDYDLLRPYEEAKACFTSSPYSEQLEILKEHVQKCRSEWATLGSFARSPARSNARAREDTKQKESSTVTSIRKQFTAGPLPESIPDICSLPGGSRMVKDIKASLAYSLGDKFGFGVAFRDLCALKAGADEEEYPVRGKFRDIVGISSSVARRYNAQNSSRGVELA